MDLANFTDVLGENADEIGNSQPLSLSLTPPAETLACQKHIDCTRNDRPARRTGQQGEFRSVEEIDPKYRMVFSYPFFNLVQSSVLDDALYSDKSMVVCAPTGSGKTVVFEMAIVQLLMELDDKKYTGDFKIIYMAPIKALCSERLSEWYPKFTRLGLMCIEVTGDTNVDFSQLKPYRIIITTPEKWDMLTRRWRDNKSLVEVIKLFLIDEVHILNDDTRGPVLEAVVSRMKTIESSSQSAYRIEQLQKQYQTNRNTEDEQLNMTNNVNMPVRIRFVAVSATVSNPEDVAAWLGTRDKPAVYCKFGDECRPVKLKRVVEGYPCSEGTSIFKFDIILNYKLWPVIQRYHNGKPTLIFCNTRKSVAMTAETLSRELTVSVTAEQQARLAALASTIKNKKLQALVLSGVGCHHAGLLFEERLHIEEAFRNRDLPILITTTTLAMGVNLPAHLVIIKNTQQYVNGAYQEYSISTVLQMVGRAGRPQFDTEATAVIMTRLQDKPRYQALVGGDEPLQSYLHKRLAENLNSEAALGTVCDVAQCVQWVRSTFLSVRAAKDPKRYLGLPQNAQPSLISKKIEELCVKAMNGLASSGLITMDDASCIESTEAGRLMSVYYIDLETMKHIMKIEGTESIEKLLWIVCESHELADMHLRVDERRTLNTLNRNNAAATIRFPMKGKINTRQMKLNCIIQAVLGCLPIPEPSLNQEAMKVMRIADRVCKCLVAYATRPDLTSNQPHFFSAIVNVLILAKCIEAHLWENSPYVSKQLKGIGPTFSTLLATAGKVNFTLLEESHPRDLERIMNKGAPAGNVVRKQVSLLPKYQLTATPLDEKRISIQLLLLNQHHLAENRDQLTAGDSHKCYVVVGDSENDLLLFTSFKDKDLINVYDGAIAYEITRKHNYEHKILIHCISANWVGIDVHCEYLFKNIEPPFLRGDAMNQILIQDTPRKCTKKQTSITDVYKERKRKSNEIDITESKEKKKRDTALVQKFKLLKSSLETSSKELKEDLAKSAQMSNMIISRMTHPDQQSSSNETNIRKPLDNNYTDTATGCNVNIDDDESFCGSKLAAVNNANDYPIIDTIDLDYEDNFVVDDHINSIMNEIETDILKTNNNPRNCANAHIKNPNKIQKSPMNVEKPFFIKTTPMFGGYNAQSVHSGINCIPKLDTYLISSKSLHEKSKRKSINTKTNYSFIDTIEKKVALDANVDEPQKDSGFSDTIKSQIEKFLQSTAKKKEHDITIGGLLSCTETTEHIGQSQNTITVPKLTLTANECSATENNNTPLSLELPAVSINVDHFDTTVQCDFNTLTEIACHTNKEKNAMKKRFHTCISNDVQNIDKIVEDIERDYKNIASKKCIEDKENYTCANNLENISDVIKLPKRGDNNCNYLENAKDDNQDSNTFKAECSGDINDNNDNTKLSDLYSSKKQVVSNSDSHTVSLMTIPTALENDVNKFNKSLSINTILPSSLLVINKHATKLNKDLCSTSNLYSKAQCHPSSKETVPLGDKTNLIVQSYDNIHNRNQKDDHNEKNVNNSTQNSNITYPNNSTEYNKAFEESTDNYIKRYSFSATKVNVCTKHLSDHKVQIIRKLKLDLDVTEIISKGNNSETNNKAQMPKDNKFYRTDKSENGMKIIQHCNGEIGRKFNNYTNYSPETKISNRNCRYLTLSQPSNYSSQKNNSLEENIITDRDDDKERPRIPQTNISLTIANNIHPISQSSLNNDTLKNVDKYNFTNTDKEVEFQNIEILTGPETEIKAKRKNTEDIEQYKKYLREIAGANCVNEKFIFSETEENTPPKICLATENKEELNKTKSNKIKNILQKYSVVLRKNNFHNDSTVKNLHNNVVIRPQSEKTYKISDIHNVRIPLPDNLIKVEASRMPRSANADKLLTIPETEKFEDTINTCRKIENAQNEAIMLNKTIECFADNLPEYNSSDTDLDQSMLNPKLLLEQCFSKDESNDNDLIIPPPSDFCDENIYSPVKLEDLTFQEYNETEQGVTPCYGIDKSIFEDSNSVLTPSVEIETWTLSRDDEETYNGNLSERHNKSVSQKNEECADYFSCQILDQNRYNANKSCTVMRRNHNVIKDLSPPKDFEINSRQGKLGYFKFTQKNKFKM